MTPDLARWLNEMGVREKRTPEPPPPPEPDPRKIETNDWYHRGEDCPF